MGALKKCFLGAPYVAVDDIWQKQYSALAACRRCLSALTSLENTNSEAFMSVWVRPVQSHGWMGRGWAWTKAQLQVIAAHYQKAVLIQSSRDWWKKALKGANLIGWCCCCVGDTCGRSCCCRDSSRRSTVHHGDFFRKGTMKAMKREVEHYGNHCNVFFFSFSCQANTKWHLQKAIIGLDQQMACDHTAKRDSRGEHKRRAHKGRN